MTGSYLQCSIFRKAHKQNSLFLARRRVQRILAENTCGMHCFLCLLICIFSETCSKVFTKLSWGVVLIIFYRFDQRIQRKFKKTQQVEEFVIFLLSFFNIWLRIFKLHLFSEGCIFICTNYCRQDER